MRTGLLTAIVALVLTAAPARAGVPVGWEPQAGVAAAYAAKRSGSVSFAVRTEERMWGRRPHTRVPSASVIKAMLMAVYLDQPGVRRRALRADEKALLAPMIRWSDNDAASRVRDIVGAPAIERFARRAGMRQFRLDPWWGLSDVTAADQTRLFLGIDRRLPARHRVYGMRLLRTIVPGQGWGIGRVAPAGWRLHFKGGWGAGTGAVNHQVALLVRKEMRVSIAVMTVGSPGDAYAQATLEGVFRRLVRGLADLPAPTTPATRKFYRMAMAELSPTMKR